MNIHSIAFLLFFLLLFSQKSQAQQSNEAKQNKANREKENISLKSPYDAIYNHFIHLTIENYEPLKASKSLFIDESKEEKVREKIAIQLKQIFTAKGLLITFEDIPKDSNFTTLISPGHQVYKYTPFPSLKEIFLIKKEDNWLYSSTSIQKIPEIHESLYPFGSNKLLEITEYFNYNYNNTFLGIYVWQYIGILSIVLISILLYIIMRLILRMIKYFLLKKYPTKIPQNIKYLPSPISLMVVFFVAKLLINILQLPNVVAHYMVILLSVTLYFFIALVLFRTVDILFFYLKKITEETENTLDDKLVPLIRRPLKVLVAVIAIIFILKSLHFNITNIMAGIGIGGIAFALAAQDTIKNLFGSFMIFIDKPFKIGDYIISPDLNGSVEEVGLRSTKIRSLTNSVISIPNGRLADQTIDNMGLRQYRLYRTSIGIRYDTTPEQIQNFIKGLKEIVNKHPRTRKDVYEIHLNDFGDSALKILFLIYFEVNNWTKELETKHEIMLEVIKLAEQLKVGFAFPSQSIYLEK